MHCIQAQWKHINNKPRQCTISLISYITKEYGNIMVAEIQKKLLNTQAQVINAKNKHIQNKNRYTKWNDQQSYSHGQI